MTLSCYLFLEFGAIVIKNDKVTWDYFRCVNVTFFSFCQNYTCIWHKMRYYCLKKLLKKYMHMDPVRFTT